MRRAIAAVLGTVAGLAALLNYKTTGVAPRTSALGATTTPTTTGAAPGPGNSPQTPSTTAAPNQSGDRVVKGTEVDNQFGPVQVSVTLRGSRIVDVTPLQMPFDHQRSQFISEQAAPMLRQEVLDAQSARIDVIGGATYTSDSYAQSLQSALDAAKQ